MRQASIKRVTTETQIALKLSIDGKGRYDVHTGIRFLDHMGAAALVTDRVVASRLHAYVNVEAAGSDGTAVLFQSGPGNGWVTTPWARVAPHPRGGSFAIEVYKRLPNDTDFTILARQNIPGLNFAAVDDGFSYHTARDVPDRLTSRALRTTGENVAAIATALDRIDITQRGRWGATYFDIGGVSALAYGMIVSWIIAAAALMLGSIACLRTIVEALRVAGGVRWILTVLWTVIGVVAVTGAMTGATCARPLDRRWDSAASSPRSSR